MNVFYVVENIDKLFFVVAGIASALVMLTYSVFSFPKDES